MAVRPPTPAPLEASGAAPVVVDGTFGGSAFDPPAAARPKRVAPKAPAAMRTAAATSTSAMRPPVLDREEGGAAPAELIVLKPGTWMTADETLETFSGGTEPGSRSPPAPGGAGAVTAPLSMGGPLDRIDDGEEPAPRLLDEGSDLLLPSTFVLVESREGRERGPVV